MALELVETKFFLPQARAGLIERTRLDLVLGGRRSRLTLLSAPAGFGKTTLLAHWLTKQAERSDLRVAWVSLDENDRVAQTFWVYVLTALERAAPGSASSGLQLLAAGQPVEAVLAAVLNELSVFPGDVVLVLDDYHLAECAQTQPGMAFLLERLPPQVRLVIITRADPALPVARLRVRGELTEVRAADLRFTDAEAARFLTEATGRDLPAADLSALGARTEGWIASLQLAALSLRDRTDTSGFIAGFTGTDRFVVDYLVEEVLDREPPEVRHFLLDTSILDRLCGSLCDAVTATDGGQLILASLERRNLFIMPLDNQRHWYRYHHLFADVLRASLLQERPEAVQGLHQRASRWYAEDGQLKEAVRHALAGDNPDSAAELIELALPELRRDRRENLLQRWATELPPEVVARRPVLAVGLVGGLMASNDFGGVAQRLREVEAMLTRPPSEWVIADIDELPRLPAAMETFWAGLALVEGDLAGTVAHARKAQSLAVEGDNLMHASAAGLVGLATWAGGDIVAAHHAYRAAADGLTKAGHIADVLGCSLTLADMELALGRLGEAERTLDHALTLAQQPSAERPSVMRGTADMLVGLSRSAWHRNELEAAADYLRRADELGEPAGLPQHPYRWRVALARLRVTAGDFVAALGLLDEAERVYVSDFSPPVHPIHATRARVLAASGDLRGAAAWVRGHDVRVDDDLAYLHEYEHLTLCRIMLAENTSRSVRDASALLDRLLAAALDGGRMGTVIEVEVMRAMAAHAVGDDHGALSALDSAVDLAEPDGWVRVFVDANTTIAPVMQTLSKRRPRSAFIHELLATNAPALAPPGSETPATPTLLDPLSDRELDVLRLLASDLDGPAIARELVVSLNTVKTHTQHIYTKLDVNNRRSAVTRGHQMGLTR
ncbi:MAG: LuxR C-terminal-related transcriptional regulator [Humibacillus sp.]|nr:LuxR C-terminal-related transcriptional regulator [Humibacillus sp.]MDN5777847.1 LuxR C-terminal-related transcriptional regulator [Humibacillus sp.]